MPSSGEIYILQKIGQLAKRVGISPAIADVLLDFYVNGESCGAHYSISVVSGTAEIPEEEEKIDKIRNLLGTDRAGLRNVSSLREVDEIVDRALSLAPRARIR